MIKESKYIIRKIIIGVGIALCLAFLNGCKVKALNSNVSYVLSSNNNEYYDENDYNYLGTYNANSRYPLYVNLYYKNDILYFSTVNNSLILDTTQEAMDGFSLNTMFLQQNSIYGSYNGLFVYDSNSYIKSYYNGINSCYTIKCNNIGFIYLHLVINGSNNTITSLSINGGYNDDNGVDTLNNCSDASIVPNIYNNRDFLVYNGSPVYDSEFTDNTLIEASTISASVPYFISFNALKTVHNNLLLGYTFAPEFSVFDTDNYEYQYRIGLNDIWLTMNENLYEFNVNANTTVYVRIKDKSNNEIIDSSTFTITGVGTFVDTNVDYDIKFNGKYRTQNYLNNNTSGTSIIQEYEIDVTFSPDSSILKYQYQYVLNGNSIDNNGWIDVTLQPSNMGNFTTVVSQNGTLYARILDSSDNIMATGSFTINSIGKIAFDNSDDKILNKYNNILNSINFGGPISGLIDIPIKLIGTIATGLSGGLTCSDYQLGNLMGTNLKLPCVNVKSWLGESLYITIDIILSACMAYHIIKMMFDLYNNLLFMEKNPVQDLGRRR